MTDGATFQQCLAAMVRGDYGECAEHAYNLLEEGAGHEILQVLVISLERLGRTDELEEIARQALKVTRRRPWYHALVRLTLGQVEAAKVLGEAADDTARCQAHYYAAARLATLGRAKEAAAELEACLAIDSPCVERQLAEAQRRRARASNGRKQTAPADPSATFRECVDSFIDSDYEGCLGKVRESTAAASLRSDLAQLMLISLQRLGRREEAERLGAQVLEAAGGHPWFRRLVQITLGEAAPDEVLAEAASDAQRCQAHYYAGARLLTLGQALEAAAEFAACLRVKVGCPEYALASVEKLYPLEGPASPGRKRRRPDPDLPV